LVELALIVLAAFAALIALAWIVGAREPVFAISRRAPAWFVALKRDRARVLDLAPGVTAAWRSRADFTFIGEGAPYWTEFMILSGGATDKAPLALGHEAADAFIARVRLVRPPPLALGVLRLLVITGMLSRPRGAVLADAQAPGREAAFMPSAEAIVGLTTRPATYAPAMVNFLQYKGADGARAYARYGRVAMRTVYRTGGQLLFYGCIVEIVRAAEGGPCAGAWDDVAAMRYNRPEAILSMEHAPDYRAALHHRDEGLARTVVIASTPGGGG
jgi:uncharacterized protein (DUF1330 family)